MKAAASPCSKCGGARTSTHAYCSPCRREYERSRPRVRDFSERRRATLKYKYNITPEEYARLRAKQADSCAICGRHESELRVSLNLDHCHSTGRFRGLLCGNCNRALGLFGDNPQLLQRAVKYLAA